jgi:hypothetical protein
MMKDSGSHSLRQGGPSWQQSKDGEAQLDAPDSEKGKIHKLLMVPHLVRHQTLHTLR